MLVPNYGVDVFLAEGHFENLPHLSNAKVVTIHHFMKIISFGVQCKFLSTFIRE